MNDAQHKDLPVDSRLRVSLFVLRISVFVVFLMWIIDKLFNYEHSSGVVLHYYHLSLPEWFLTSLGIAESVVLLMFLCGVKKTFSYAVILSAHTASTVASSWRLIPPYEVHQLLYFGSIPMLAACTALFLLRERDTLLSLRGGAG